LEGLCSSLQGLVREVEYGADGCAYASFVLADAEDDWWLPEVKVRSLANGNPLSAQTFTFRLRPTFQS
jgi:hypothetical protein